MFSFQLMLWFLPFSCCFFCHREQLGQLGTRIVNIAMGLRLYYDISVLEDGVLGDLMACLDSLQRDHAISPDLRYPHLEYVMRTAAWPYIWKPGELNMGENSGHVHLPMLS
jgi:hypothetical protein